MVQDETCEKAYTFLVAILKDAATPLEEILVLTDAVALKVTLNDPDNLTQTLAPSRKRKVPLSIQTTHPGFTSHSQPDFFSAHLFYFPQKHLYLFLDAVEHTVISL